MQANATNIFSNPPIKTVNADDVRLLIRHPKKDIRAGAAQRICRTFRDGKLNDEEREFAYKILNYMVHDVADIVRRALSVTLKNSPNLPRNIALKLAADIDNIAIPILENSPVFNDSDLIEVIKSKAAAKIVAVAKRKTLSDHITRAIVRFGDHHAVAEMAANDGAVISEDTAAAILSIYHDDDLIKESFIDRRDLPTSIAEKLITLVTEEAAIQLQQRHALSPDVAIDLATRTRQRATVDVIDQSWLSRDVQNFVERLDLQGRLDTGLIIRAACCGQMRFVEYALARLAKLNHAKAAIMIHDSGPFGLQALCARIGLSARHIHILRAACAIFRDLENSGMTYDRGDFQEVMLQRVMTLPVEFSVDDQNYFLEKLDSLVEIRAVI